MARTIKTDKKQRRPGVDVGLITLTPSPFNAGKIWMQHAGGEGMEVSIKKLERTLCRFFWREF